MATILEGLNAISQAVGGAGEAESNLEALNQISEALGGSADAESNADAIANIAENASGGSSDFSTAEVTVTFAPSTSEGGLPTILDVSLPNIVYLGHPDMQYFISSVISGSGGTATFTAVLYQGKAVALSADYYIKNLSGDIEWNDDIGNYIITGDCAFTLSETE